MTSVVIVGAKRSPIGNFNGALSSLSAHEIGAQVILDILQTSGIKNSDVTETILGQVLTASQGQNPARQTHIAAGLPIESSAWNINQVCGSGLRAVSLGVQQIESDESNIIIAGGQESMSKSPHAILFRKGKKMGDTEFIDTMIKDGLWDAFYGYHMGMTAENIAEKWQISRREQDEFAYQSQVKADKSQTDGKFKDEISPITIESREGKKFIEKDEYIRHGITMENIEKLRPAFKEGGTVTAGNASGVNDGAAMVLLMSSQQAEKRGLTPLARIVSFSTAGVDPKYMGIGPVSASKKALDKAGWEVSDLDLIESNEAFAAQSLAVTREMGWDPSIVNVNGGAIAIGHPIGASGCRILNTLIYELHHRKVNKGLATLCIGGGMGVSMCIEAIK
ncbi:MAG: acetyl-CoA C-acyltransferase [Rhodobacteraceae bacterium]|jgi:acetyl-CoA C-acetyltransferase|nr:MAG: acetyl-CoA C-acyltransferase [Paracoccaceae bacterium]|tara:strand:+ start:129 stop:1307 length:1179 start_codon:yes stop_codon:yes gene_type:complete